MIGTNAAIVPLVIGTIPFIGRIVENALEEVPYGLIKAAQAMGATPTQIMWKFLLPEALPTIINGLTVTSILLVSYSAMAGAVGGGGLGDLGIRYGYQRFNISIMIATVVILIVLVQLLQWLGDFAAKKFNKRWEKNNANVKIYRINLLLPLILGLAACKHHEANNIVKVGIIDGPDTAEWEAAQKVALKNYGLHIKLVKFSNYTMPNEALNDDSIDANAFQHVPFLDAQIKARGYKLVTIAKTFLNPIALYSKKVTSLAQLKKGDKIGIPNDPSNEARALLLLQQGKLITLKKGAGLTATPVDIAKNPKQLKMVELPAAQLPRALKDLTAAVVNDDYAEPASLNPKKSLLVESSDSPYMNVIVVRSQDKNKKKIQELIKSFQSPEVKAVGLT